MATTQHDPITGTDLHEVIEEPLWRIRLRLWWQSFKKNWGLFVENRIGLVGLAIIAVFALMALIQPILIGTGTWPSNIYDPVVGNEPNPPTFIKTVVNEVEDPDTQISFREALLDDPAAQIGDMVEIRLQPAPPFEGHLLGTDPLGRDILSQLMFGARAAFALGAIAALVTVFIATTVGAVAAYFGGWIDTAFMRLADLLLMLPGIALLIVLSLVIPNFTLTLLALVLGVLGGFGGTAIILKSQALAVKVKPYIDAAEVAGGSKWRIIFSHLIPNVLPLSFLYMMFSVTGAIAVEATLSFLGLLNIRMSWGLMIQVAQSQGYLLQPDKWWLVIPAGLAVTLLAFAFFLVGRAMDEVVNPRLRSR